MKHEKKQWEREDDHDMISIKHKGDFKKTERFFKKIGEGDYLKGLEEFGQSGVDALYEATPKRTGKTASSWNYSIKRTKEDVRINWNNTNVVNGANIALLIQNGHGTSSGRYVQGIDYINPALSPVLDEIGNNVWAEVTNDD